MKKLVLISSIFLVSVVLSFTGTSFRRSSKAFAFSDQTIQTGYSQLHIGRGITVKAVPAQPDSGEFILSIPRIALKKEVVANVDPSDKAVYLPVIERKVAHGRYTMLPSQATENGNVYLFAHREGSGNFFARLGELVTGDRIEVRFSGRTYLYTVSEKFVVGAKDTWVYTGTSALPTLTLQTCENGNTHRLIVKALLNEVI
jgi:LPXTG-site transpeptidase (sortase) family protein